MVLKNLIYKLQFLYSFMKPRFSQSSRHTGHLQNIRKQKKKFPAQLDRVIKESDILLEIIDARFISQTINPEINELIKKQNKKIIHVLNKADLVDKFSKPELASVIPYSIVSCRERKGVKTLRNKIKFLARSIQKEKIFVGVIGYPNTGKSSLINALVGKSSAGTGQEAGFTKGIQKLKLTNKIFLLDSPGVIPKTEYSTSEIDKISKQVMVNARSYNQVRDPEMVVAVLMQESPEILENYYSIDSEKNSEKLLEELGNKKHFFKKGCEVDFDKTARFILKEWQSGKIKF